MPAPPNQYFMRNRTPEEQVLASASQVPNADPLGIAAWYQDFGNLLKELFIDMPVHTAQVATDPKTYTMEEVKGLPGAAVQLGQQVWEDWSNPTQYAHDRPAAFTLDLAGLLAGGATLASKASKSRALARLLAEERGGALRDWSGVNRWLEERPPGRSIEAHSYRVPYLPDENPPPRYRTREDFYLDETGHGSRDFIPRPREGKDPLAGLTDPVERAVYGQSEKDILEELSTDWAATPANVLYDVLDAAEGYKVIEAFRDAEKAFRESYPMEQFRDRFSPLMLDEPAISGVVHQPLASKLVIGKKKGFWPEGDFYPWYRKANMDPESFRYGQRGEKIFEDLPEEVFNALFPEASDPSVAQRLRYKGREGPYVPKNDPMDPEVGGFLLDHTYIPDPKGHGDIHQIVQREGPAPLINPDPPEVASRGWNADLEHMDRVSDAIDEYVVKAREESMQAPTLTDEETIRVEELLKETADMIRQQEQPELRGTIHTGRTPGLVRDRGSGFEKLGAGEVSETTLADRPDIAANMERFRKPLQEGSQWDPGPNVPGQIERPDMQYLPLTPEERSPYGPAYQPLPEAPETNLTGWTRDLPEAKQQMRIEARELFQQKLAERLAERESADPAIMRANDDIMEELFEIYANREQSRFEILSKYQHTGPVGSPYEATLPEVGYRAFQEIVDMLIKEGDLRLEKWQEASQRGLPLPRVNMRGDERHWLRRDLPNNPDLQYLDAERKLTLDWLEETGKFPERHNAQRVTPRRDHWDWLMENWPYEWGQRGTPKGDILTPREPIQTRLFKLEDLPPQITQSTDPDTLLGLLLDLGITDEGLLLELMNHPTVYGPGKTLRWTDVGIPVPRNIRGGRT